MANLQGKHILVGISGGIAAYKIPELVRLLQKQGAEVRVTTTRSALQFVTELTLQTLSGAPVYSDVFAAINEHATEHISLPEWADLMIVAPATANVLSKFAYGIADDALTTTFCSCLARKPILVSPAMNDKMWENPATQQAVSRLRSFENVTVIEPAEGFLACGVNGRGRMPEVEELLEHVLSAVTPKTLAGKRVLITAGPTVEPLDPVRYISNFSSGKMGYALARECLRRGAEVTLVSGPTAQQLIGHDAELTLCPVQTAREMCAAAEEAFREADTAILCAAVADYRPETVAEEKIKKQAGSHEMTLLLTENPDIAATLGGQKRPNQTLVGFALETEAEEQHALDKMQRKQLDYIVLNSLRNEGAGFGTDTNRVTVYRKDGTKKDCPLASKETVACQILDAILI
ncbi:MAG: bifunctional phosphopantothenoylcysteine decarboxylase/phosphopantothenate--cysteine ligase CoaBC [Paludibacteraceae bacterium]|nr:bifunctional phosphopantothenoylcysteine decarboxylase/phosphopantothenate--cysteine ligase CoaBC [Paludibacteraceae bacterium]